MDIQQIGEAPGYPKFYIDGYDGKMSVCSKEYISGQPNLTPILLADLAIISNECRNSSTSSTRDRPVFLVWFKDSNNPGGRKAFWMNSLDIFEDKALTRINQLRQNLAPKIQSGDARASRTWQLLDEYLQARNISNTDALNTIIKANSILAKGPSGLDEKLALTNSVPTKSQRSTIEQELAASYKANQQTTDLDVKTQVAQFTEQTLKSQIQALQTGLGDPKSADRAMFLTELDHLISKTEGLIKNLHKKTRV